MAAGLSTRMGRNKAILPWLGGTLLEYQIRQLTYSKVCRIILVVGHDAAKLRLLAMDNQLITIVNNPNYKNGRATSVVAGINALDSRTSAVLILNVDQPRTTALLDATIDNHFEGPGLITIPTYRGQRGHPSIFDASLITELSQILDVNMGLKEVIHRKPSRIHEFRSSSPITILDINRPEEYKDGLDLFKNSEPSNR